MKQTAAARLSRKTRNLCQMIGFGARASALEWPPTGHVLAIPSAPLAWRRTDNAAPHPHAHRHTALRCARAVRRRGPIADAKRSSSPRCASADCHQSGMPTDTDSASARLDWLAHDSKSPDLTQRSVPKTGAIVTSPRLEDPILTSV